MESRVFYTENKFVFLFSFKFSCLPMLRPICLALVFFNCICTVPMQEAGGAIYI